MSNTEIINKALQFRKNLKTLDLNSEDFSKFYIDSSDKVLGYYECRYGLIGLGITKCIVFTDNAMYLDPGAGKDNSKSNNRIPYQGLCNYICKGADVLSLHSRDKELCIIKGSLIGAFSDVGTEIFDVINYIDSKMSDIDDEYRFKKIRLMRDIIGDTEEMILSGTYDGSKFEAEISKITAFGVYKQYVRETIAELLKLAVALAKYDYLKEACDLADKNSSLSDNDIVDILGHYIDRCLHLYREYDKSINANLKNVLETNLGKTTKYPSDGAHKDVIQMFSSFSKELKENFHTRDATDIDTYYKGIKEVVSGDLLQDLVIKKATEIDRKMYTAFRMLESGFVVEPADYPYVDSLGLDILHYAILLRNNDQIDKCLKEKVVLDELYGGEASSVVDFVYDYTLLALYIDTTSDHELFMKVYLNSEEMQSIMKVRKEMDIKLKFYNAALGAAGALQGFGHLALRKSEKELERGTADFGYEEVEDYRYVVEDYDDELHYKSEMYDMLLEDFQMLNDEIAMCCIAAYEELKKYIDDIQSSKLKFVKVLLRLYNSPDLIGQYLKEADSRRHFGIYATNESACAFIDSFFAEKLEWDEWWNDEEFNDSFVGYEKNDACESDNHEGQSEKPYGNSWFSDKAHRSLKQMRKEYHILANKYHPDNNPEMLEIFLSIQEERAEIISKIQ